MSLSINFRSLADQVKHHISRRKHPQYSSEAAARHPVCMDFWDSRGLLCDRQHLRSSVSVSRSRSSQNANLPTANTSLTSSATTGDYRHHYHYLHPQQPTEVCNHPGDSLALPGSAGAALPLYPLHSTPCPHCLPSSSNIEANNNDIIDLQRYNHYQNVRPYLPPPPQPEHHQRSLSVGSAEDSPVVSLMDSPISTFHSVSLSRPRPVSYSRCPSNNNNTCNRQSVSSSGCCSASASTSNLSNSSWLYCPPVVAGVTCISPLERFTHSGHANQLLVKMSEDLRNGGRLSDICLIAGEKRLPAHRVVLSAASDYFSAMFSSELMESRQTEISIRDVHPEALETLLEYIYTGNLTLHEDTVENLLSAACLLQMTEVIRACERFLIRLLHSSNCLGIRQFAEVRGCQLLYQQATDYTLDHFPSVIQHHEFLVLLNFEDLISLLQSENLNVPEELIVFQSCLHWTRHDLLGRRQHFSQLLASVKLPLLPPDVLSDVVESDPLISESVECLRLIVEAMRYHLLPDRQTEVSAKRCRPRKSTIGRLWAVGGMTTSCAIQELQEYNPRTECWTRVGKLPLQRLQFGCAVIDGCLLIVGGRDGLKTLNTVECYDPSKKNWQVLASMATHRHGLGVSVLHGVLYAVGGHDGWSYLNSVERWDPRQKSWSFVSPMSMPRSTVGVAALQGKLYAVGGRDGSACLRTVECFDPHLQKWALCAPMHCRRGGLGLASVAGFLYAVGGHDAPASHSKTCRFSSVERYDPATDAWTEVACLSNPRESVALCPLGDKLYALGGFDGHVYNEQVQSYDPVTDTWAKMTPLPSGRAGVVAVAIPASVFSHLNTPSQLPALPAPPTTSNHST